MSTDNNYDEEYERGALESFRYADTHPKGQRCRVDGTVIEPEFVVYTEGGYEQSFTSEDEARSDIARLADLGIVGILVDSNNLTRSLRA